MTNIYKTLLFLGVFATGCTTLPASENDGVPARASTFGDEEQVWVRPDLSNIPARYHPLIDAFGQMERVLAQTAHTRSTEVCTITHIGHGLALTAGHCFDAPRERTDNLPCDKYTVKWGFLQDEDNGDERVALEGRCTRVLTARFDQANHIDYAIIEVDKTPSTVIPVDLQADAPVGTPLTLFGYPTPYPLQWSMPCTLMPLDGNSFNHICDTEGGNSGGAMLRDDNLSIVGIHWWGGIEANSATYVRQTPLAEILAARR